MLNYSVILCINTIKSFMLKRGKVKFKQVCITEIDNNN